MIAIVKTNDPKIKIILGILEQLKIPYEITLNEMKIMNADKIIYYDSGNAADAMRRLYISNLATMFRITKKPFLGISLGMLLLSGKIEENINCLGIIPVDCKKFSFAINHSTLVNKLKIKSTKKCELQNEIPEDTEFLFENSFYLPICDYTYASSFCEEVFSAIIKKDNFYGVQFSPEENHQGWVMLIKNFVEKC